MNAVLEMPSAIALFSAPVSLVAVIVGLDPRPKGLLTD
jgi:hypothetical protein